MPGNLLREGNSREIRVSWNGKWGIGPSTKIETVVSRGTELDFELTGDAAGEGEAAEAEEERPLARQRQQPEAVHDLSSQLQPEAPQHTPLRQVEERTSISNSNSTGRPRPNPRGPATPNGCPLAGCAGGGGSLTASYKFSESFRGDGLIRIQDDLNQLTEKTRKSREVKFSGTMFFR